MRALALVMLVSFTGLADNFIYSLPNGHFAGQGTWRDNDLNTGTYATYVEIQNNDMRVEYNWEDSQSLTVFLSFDFYNAGEFYVWFEGERIGQGTCSLEQQACTYDLVAAESAYHEHLQFDFLAEGGPILSKTGHKQRGDRLVEWQDGLHLVNLEDPDPVILPIP